MVTVETNNVKALKREQKKRKVMVVHGRGMKGLPSVGIPRHVRRRPVR